MASSSSSDTINKERSESADDMEVSPPPPPTVADLTVVRAKPPRTPPRQAKKRGSSALQLLRAVLFMGKRSRSRNNKIPTDAEVVEAVRKTGLWRRLISGVRPLHPHPQLVQSSPPRHDLPQSPDRSFHDVHLPPPSPAASYCSTSSFSPSPDGMTSRYASVGDLLALDDIDDGEDDIDSDGGGGEDGERNLIDVQADEFIARFYEQIRLQRVESVARRRREDRWSFHVEDVDV